MALEQHGRRTRPGSWPALASTFWRGGETGQQPQRVPLTLREGQEHLPGRRIGETGRKQRETALVAADDAELLTGEPAFPRAKATSRSVPARSPSKCGHPPIKWLPYLAIVLAR